MNTHNATAPSTTRRERGATLIISMILLMVVTLLAVTSLRATIQEERATASAYDRNLAFQSAEAGLRLGEAAAATWAEGGLPTLANPFVVTPPCTTGLSATGLYDGPIHPDCMKTVLDTPGGRFEDTAGFPGADKSLTAYYVVEYLTDKAICNPHAPITEDSTLECKRFRVTAKSDNASGTRASITLQSIYAVGGESAAGP
jgi:type IV pilus assembly protein PilX